MLIQQVIGGMAIGSVYALVAIGYTLIWRALNVLNFSQGDLLMLGAYVGFSFNVLSGLDYFTSMIMSMLVGALVGVLYALILKPIRGRKGRTDNMVVTIGLSTIIRNLCRIFWGADTIRMPEVFSTQPIEIFGVLIPPTQIYISLIAVFLVIILTLFFSKAKWGQAMRAAAQDRATARLMGIPVFRCDMYTLMISSALAAAAGVLIGPIYFISPDMGAYNGQKAFLASTIGGLGNVGGGLFGGYFLGVVEYLAAIQISSGYKDIISFIILIIVLIVLPDGFSSLFKKSKEKV